MNCDIGLSYKGVNCPFWALVERKNANTWKCGRLLYLVASYYTLSPFEVFCDLLELEGVVLERTTVS